MLITKDNIWEMNAKQLVGGLGCACSEMDDTGACLDPEPCSSQDVSSGPFVGPPINVPIYSNSNLKTSPASVIASISQSFANIFKTMQPLPAGCTQVSGPYGLSTQCLGNQQVSNPLGFNTIVGSGFASSGSLLLPLLIGGGLLLVLSKH